MVVEEEVLDPMESPFEAPKVVEEEEGGGGPSKDELQKMYDELKAKHEGVAAQADQTSALKGSFDALGKQLGEIVSRPMPMPAPVQQKPTESWADFRARIDKDIIDKPSDILVEFAERYISPATEALAASQLKLSKRLAVLSIDSDERELFKRYGDEIEGVVMRMSPQERVQDDECYLRAFNFVKANHLNELIEAKLAAERAKIGASAQQSAAATAPRAPVGTLERGSPLAGPTSAKEQPTIRLKPGQGTEIRNYMRTHGIPEDKFEITVENLREAGMI
jgi:hypothetical protein